MNDAAPLISMIVPTYNEAQNIDELINRVHAALTGISHEIIVVDDDSPDMTWRIVEERSQRDPLVRIIRRKNDRGLSKAVVAGFNEARGDLLGVIDADLQHDERILPDMIRHAASAPIVIGSRYVEGGGVGDWGFGRRLKSWLATKFAALVLNVTVNDPMAGFFIVKREVYQGIKDKINPLGFKILLEVLYHSNERAAEVPYTFRVRTSGESKLTSKVAWDYLKQVMALRKNNPVPGSFIKYCLVGASGVIVDMGFFSLSFRLLLPAVLAGVLASQIAVISNFIFNDIWTFSDRQGGGLIHRFMKYEITCLIGISIKCCIILILFNLLAMNPYLANGLGILTAIATNFIFSKLWVWRHNRG